MRFQSHVLATRVLTPTVVELTLSCPDTWSFQPGQFVTLLQDTIRRSYSIASSPRQRTSFDLCIKNVAGGRLSPFLCSLSEGATLDVIGPLGRFMIQSHEHNMVFIATGTGIAPFRSMIASLLHEGVTKHITLYTGYRFEEEILYADQTNQWQRTYPQFHRHTIISRPKEGYTGPKGHVQDLLTSIDTSAQYYLCGLNAMIQDVKVLLQNKGVSKEQIFIERYD